MKYRGVSDVAGYIRQLSGKGRTGGFAGSVKDGIGWIMLIVIARTSQTIQRKPDLLAHLRRNRHERQPHLVTHPAAVFQREFDGTWIGIEVASPVDVSQPVLNLARRRPVLLPAGVVQGDEDMRQEIGKH